jgi:diguanylate cyclase
MSCMSLPGRNCFPVKLHSEPPLQLHLSLTLIRIRKPAGRKANHMKYRHSKEESAEYLRLALPLMSSQIAALHPLSYAVWYEYVAGMNTLLTNSVDMLLGRKTPLSESDILALYEQHVADISSEAANSFSASFQKILSEMMQSTSTAAHDADVFGGILQQLGQDCKTRPGAIDLKALLESTLHMQSSVTSLTTRLDRSRQEIDKLREEVARAREASLIDGLTGLINRRGFDQTLGECLVTADADASVSGPCMLMCDIDHFKTINDTYGHLFGDKVIRAVAGIILNNIKGGDSASRYGGEEFVVLLPETSEQGAKVLAEHIRRAVEKGRIRRGTREDTDARVTLSLGLARYRRGEGPASFIERADKALYASKQNGRNRVTLAVE